MKKTVIILGTALVVFTNFAMASNQKPAIKNQIETSSNSSSALHKAVCKGDLEGVKKIIEYGTNVNKIIRNMTPLMLAARYNHVEIVKVLLANGANPYIENDHGFRALDYAKYANAEGSAAILKDLK
ncbi:ankyrin repeat domain-containing protein [Flavobacterium panacagri]|uniref:ankyrin repeat domain-containing protein n=1 Tax=Flavobacterium panacagri TaxID=3034146 RepID=UPI0025A65A5A|nr:ankyrin repeat domain-containing protein [Flavobacterium panacagri]